MCYWQFLFPQTAKFLDIIQVQLIQCFFSGFSGNISSFLEEKFHAISLIHQFSPHGITNSVENHQLIMITNYRECLGNNCVQFPRNIDF